MKTSHREGDTLVGRWRGKKRRSEGTQEEKWIMVRGRVDWRTGGLWEPICRPGSLPLAPEAREAKCSTNIFHLITGDFLQLILRKEKTWTFPWQLCEDDANHWSNKLHPSLMLKRRRTAWPPHTKPHPEASRQPFPVGGSVLHLQGSKASLHWSSHLWLDADRLLRVLVDRLKIQFSLTCSGALLKDNLGRH